MAKGKSTWKYNKLLTARRNYFDGLSGSSQIQRMAAPPAFSPDIAGLGGTVVPQTPTVTATTTSNPNIFQSAGSDIKGLFTNPGAALASPTMGMTSMLGAAAGAIGSIGGQLLSNGLESKAGSIVSGVGDALGGVPIIGGFAKGALNLIGGGVNALFGSKLNQANINAANADIDRMNNALSDASDFDALSQKIASTAGRAAHDKGFYGRDGVFSNKAKKVQREMEERARVANERQNLALLNNAEALSSDQLSSLEANYSAFGGPLDFGDGAIGFDFLNRYIMAKEAAAYGKDGSISSMPNTFAMGGSTHGADFTNGMVIIDNGGSHESNPFEGVPMGVDMNGTPNLVEEGETIFNDYVFSKRLTVPKAIRNKYKLRGTKDISFAEASKQMAKESEERPNDPISQRGLQALMADLASSQESIKDNNMSSEFAEGGHLFAGGGLRYNNGRLTESDPLYGTYKDYLTDGAVDFGKLYASDSPWMQRRNQISTLLGDREGSKAFREWYATQLNDYNKGRKGYTPYSADDITKDLFDRWSSDKKLGFGHNVMGYDGIDQFLSPRKTGERRYLLGPDKDANGTPLDPYAGATLIEDYDPDNAAYNYVARKAASEGDTDYTDYYYRKLESDPTAPVVEGEVKPEETKPDELKQGKYADWLRYAPAVGFGIGVLTDMFGLTNKPDYSNADAILEATRSGGTYQPVSFNPIGNYLAYNPLDRDYYLNKMSAEAGATRRAVLQNAGMNRGAGMAALLAADNNTQNQMGALARQAEEYNLAQRQQVEDFNRATNMTNSQGFLQADIANQKAQAEMRDFSMKGTLAAAQMREAARQSADAAKSANLSGLFQTLGDIGFEEKNAKMRDWAIRHGVFGPGTEDYGRFKRAKGGKIRRRKGLTF